MLMLCLSGFLAGSSFGLFGRALALAVGMTGYSVAVTLLVAVPGGWSLGAAFFAFVGVLIAFQAGYLIVAGLRFIRATSSQRAALPRANRHLAP
jgi:hypothetical protein